MDDSQSQVNARWGRPAKQRDDETTLFKKKTKQTLGDDYWSNIIFANNHLPGDDENDDFFSDL